MFVKVSYDLSSPVLAVEPEALVFRYGGELRPVVTLTPSSTDPAGKWAGEALGELTPPPPVAADLSSSPVQVTDRLVGFFKEVHRQLLAYLQGTVEVLAWRRGHSVGETQLWSKHYMWSIDGDDWHDLQKLTRISLRLSVGLPVPKARVPPEILEDVRNLVETGVAEPLGRHLLREAWAQREASPRSALVLAIAAAEVGFKQFIGSLVPHAAWLVQNLPTPPLEAMLVKYLPSLPVKLRIKGKTVSIPDRILSEIRSGVLLRNQIAHKGAVSPKSDKLQRILFAVSDLLWILDLYGGYAWAGNYLRPELIAAWKDERG